MFKALRRELSDEIILPDARFLPKKTDGFLAWMWFFMRPYGALIWISFVIRTVRFVSYALVIYFFGKLVDVLQSGYAFEHPAVVWMNIAYVAAGYLLIMLGYFILLPETLAVNKIFRGLTIYSVNHLMLLPLDWHEGEGSGAKLQRVMQARTNFREMYFLFVRNVLHFIGETIGIVITVIALKMPSYFLLLFAGYIASYLFASTALNSRLDEMQNSHNALMEKLVSKIYEFVSLVKTAKTFALGRYVHRNAYEGENTAFLMMKKIRTLSFLKWTVMNFSVWFWLVLIIGIGFNQVLQQEITIGAFSAIIFMAYRFWTVMEEIAGIQIDYIDYRSGFMRICETLCVPVQNYDIAPVVKMPRDWDAVTCRDLGFSYVERQPVLQGIDLTIPRGKRIALIGHSGAGKSTLVKLLMKQNLPGQGSIMIGDTDLKHIDSHDWLHHLALVPQDVELINASLRENILLDQTDINEEFYRECLHKAYLEEFVNGLPQGDLTQIGERGVKLSGGQRQRLGIARALVRRAQIIIFDEATSSLDSESEAHIQQAMHDSFEDKTVIMIAHRLSTIRQADMIYVLDQGRVAEAGSFAELEAKQGGIFARLWAMQSDGFLPV